MPEDILAQEQNKFPPEPGELMLRSLYRISGVGSTDWTLWKQELHFFKEVSNPGRSWQSQHIAEMKFGRYVEPDFGRWSDCATDAPTTQWEPGSKVVHERATDKDLENYIRLLAAHYNNLTAPEDKERMDYWLEDVLKQDVLLPREKERVKKVYENQLRKLGYFSPRLSGKDTVTVSGFEPQLGGSRRSAILQRKGLEKLHKGPTVLHHALDLIDHFPEVNGPDPERTEEIHNEIRQIAKNILRFTYGVDTSGISGTKRAAIRLGDMFFGRIPKDYRFSVKEGGGNSLTMSTRMSDGSQMTATLFNRQMTPPTAMFHISIEDKRNSRVTLDVIATRNPDNQGGSCGVVYTPNLTPAPGEEVVPTIVNLALEENDIPPEVTL